MRWQFKRRVRGPGPLAGGRLEPSLGSFQSVIQFSIPVGDVVSGPTLSFLAHWAWKPLVAFNP